SSSRRPVPETRHGPHRGAMARATLAAVPPSTAAHLAPGRCDDGDMPTLRLALAQTNPTVGDLSGNSTLVREQVRRATAAGAHLVMFPEMTLTGYPPEDLVFREAFVAASRRCLEDLATTLVGDGAGDCAVVVGYLGADGPARLSADSDP